MTDSEGESGVQDSKKNQESKDANLSPIQKFFFNANIFITGGTGFLGILLLEKLIYACPGINKIYLLTRNKKGKDIQTRLDHLFDDVVFSRLKKECQNFRDKIVPVEGDCEFPDLGLTFQDRSILIKEVNIVFHVAATVRFDEDLKKASLINVRGVRDILRLVQEMPNIKSILHVSTAYSNCIQSHIKEEVYPAAMDYKKLLDVTESLSDDILTSITPKLLGDFPNTYSFTKQIGEDVVRQEGKGLPVGIYRPSIVLSTYREPLRGWINNFYGPTGHIAAGGMGIVRTAQVGAQIEANIVPADMVVNSMIATAWGIAEDFIRGTTRIDHVPVYNYSADQAPTWDNYINMYVQNAYKYCTVNALWYMWFKPSRTHFGFMILAFFLHTVPAVLLDTVLLLQKKTPMLMKIYKKIDKVGNLVTFFLLREWTFESKNLSSLISRISTEDKQIFFCDLRNFDWKDYFDYYAQGVRVYLLKDPLDTLPQGRKKCIRAQSLWYQEYLG